MRRAVSAKRSRSGCAPPVATRSSSTSTGCGSCSRIWRSRCQSPAVTRAFSSARRVGVGSSSSFCASSSIEKPNASGTTTRASDMLSSSCSGGAMAWAFRNDLNLCASCTTAGPSETNDISLRTTSRGEAHPATAACSMPVSFCAATGIEPGLASAEKWSTSRSSSTRIAAASSTLPSGGIGPVVTM